MKYYWCAMINGDQPGAYLGGKIAVAVQKQITLVKLRDVWRQPYL